MRRRLRVGNGNILRYQYGSSTDSSGTSYSGSSSSGSSGRTSSGSSGGSHSGSSGGRLRVPLTGRLLVLPAGLIRVFRRELCRSIIRSGLPTHPLRWAMTERMRAAATGPPVCESADGGPVLEPATGWHDMDHGRCGRLASSRRRQFADRIQYPGKYLGHGRISVV